MNRWYLDPVFLGRYPEELAEVFGEAWDDGLAAAAPGLIAPPDWLGINYYSRNVVRDDPGTWPTRAARVVQEGAPHTELGWEVYPEGLGEVLAAVVARYETPPLYVTENGAAFADPPPGPDGTVDDPRRVAYLRDHLRVVAGALAGGVDLRGYFVWSLLDNLEWAQGFSKRFGLVAVDFATQRRTIKASGRFYAEVIRSGGAVLEAADL